jgi:hypothetical protein
MLLAGRAERRAARMDSFDLQELRRWMGHPEQLYGSRVVEVADGPGEGIRAVELWNAVGLRLDVLVNRGFDVHRAEFRGRSLHWVGPPALRSRFAYEPEGWGWLRSFHGGLIVTCGLEHTRHPIERATPEYGFPFEREGHFGLHGRIANEGGQIIVRDVEEGPDGPALRVVGTVAQAALYGENLELRREIRVPIFRPEFSLVDVVTNRGFSPTHHEFLYHINLGYPLVSEGARVDFDEVDGPVSMTATAPQRGFVEQVTAHKPRADSSGLARVAIHNGAGDLGLELRFRTESLPWFYLWYMMGEGPYVIGFEPSSVSPDAPRTADRLGYLAPGESVRYEATFSVLDGAAHAPR